VLDPLLRAVAGRATPGFDGLLSNLLLGAGQELPDKEVVDVAPSAPPIRGPTIGPQK
jgi:hypothetical protein